MMHNLEKEEDLFDALDGLIAYDHGSTDSGIHDDVLRAAVKAKLEAIRKDGLGEYGLYSKAFSSMMGRFIEKHFLGPEAIGHGYGYEDMRSFLEWLHDDMGVLE